MPRPTRRSFIAVGALVLVAGMLQQPVAQAGPSRTTAPVRALGRTPPLRQVATQQAAASVHAAGVHAQLAQAQLDAKHLRQESEFGADTETAASSGVPSSSSRLPVGSGAGLIKAWQGSNHFDSRYSGNGNQFSGEPPDQGLCVGNGSAFEIVNQVVQIYSTSGTAKLAGDPFFPGTAPVGVTLNQFFGVAPSFTRPDGPFGPFLFDPSCLFDARADRWFVVAAELGQDPTTGVFNGPSSEYLAVSDTADPLGSWTVWTLDTTNNGKGGTPNDRCSSGFCYGDYPHIGLNGGAFVISTNEFDNLGDGEFHGAQLYVFSKADLIAGDTSPTIVYLHTIGSDTVGDLAFSLEPVNALPADWDGRAGGTLYFGMSQSPYGQWGGARHMTLWALRGTDSLSGGSPSLSLVETQVGTEPYKIPQLSRQRRGPTPFLDCANLGVACYGEDLGFVRGPIPLDSGGGQVFGTWMQGGVVYLTTATALTGWGAAVYNATNGHWHAVHQRAAVAYFALRPDPTGSFHASLTQQGYAGVRGNNLIYPSIALDRNGDGAIGVTLVGPDYYPSVAYIPFHAGASPTSVQGALWGVGPDDGFTGTAIGAFQPRWGDYGAAMIGPDGNIYVGAEYIAQSCTFKAFVQDSTCGFTRTLLANWSTGIAKIAP
ncbi:MAG: hypothetical protein ACXVQJ_05990 [Actinomycetota bacterium]